MTYSVLGGGRGTRVRLEGLVDESIFSFKMWVCKRFVGRGVLRFA